MHLDGPLLGVLGGLGPLATADFMRQLVELADAARDQDHCRTIVYSNPRVPDRSAALLHRGPSPLPGLLEGVAVLGRCGADVIAMPCNTAHRWLGALVASSTVPILSIVDAVVVELGHHPATARRIGVLGTAGMIEAGIYQAGLSSLGYDILLPTAQHLYSWVEPAIRSVKANDIAAAVPPLAAAVAALEDEGADTIVLGCTELPLALTATHSPRGTPYVDSTRSLAKACLAWMAAQG